MKTRKRKMKTVRMATYTWEAPTLTEARAKRDEHLEGLLWDVSSPTVIRGPAGVLVVIYRDVLAWNYDIIRPGSVLPGDAIHGSSVIGLGSRREAIVMARRHLAQMAYGEDGEDCRGEDSDGVRYLHRDDEEGLAENKRWVRWQRTYAKMTAPVEDGGLGLEIHEAERRLAAGERF